MSEKLKEFLAHIGTPEWQISVLTGRLHATQELLREARVKITELEKQLCQYQIAEIGSKLVEEMEDE
jgi:hypothetical protein